MMDTERLGALRKEMKRERLSRIIIHRRDPHLNEYLHPFYEQVSWISNFTGSNGTLLVLNDIAYLYTDSRYFIQAKQQLPEGIHLSRLGVDPTLSERLLKVKGRVGINPQHITQKEYERMSESISEKVELVMLEEDIIDRLWKTRPSIVPEKLQVMKNQKPFESKIKDIQNEMRKNQDMYPNSGPLDSIVISDMDEIAWLTNLRGTDIPMSRLFYAYAYIDYTQAILFTDSILPESHASIKQKRYSEFYPFIKKLSNLSIGVSSNTNYKISQILEDSNRINKFTAILNMKGIKTPEEIQGFRESNTKDSVYICMLFGEISRRLKEGKVIGELEASELLQSIKEKDKEFIGPSFETISSFAEHGAIIHYSPKDNKKKLSTNGLFLLDSGSQYEIGTTDITRTVCFGTPTEEQRTHYTSVIKGNMALEMARFPPKTALGALSPIVRTPIWSIGLDYGHSTGHGVGYGLNVHEGPHTLDSASQIKAMPGMVVTCEPGIYIEGKHGIRHENLMVVEEDTVKGFLKLTNLTPTPLHLSLLDTSMLSPKELQHINTQSTYIREHLAPLLQHSPDGLKWLEQNTKQLPTSMLSNP